MKTPQTKGEVSSNKFTDVPTSKSNHYFSPLNNSEKIISDKKVIHFLKTLPYLEFTATGINNIVKRFGITPEHLFILIDFVRKGGLQNGK